MSTTIQVQITLRFPLEIEEADTREEALAIIADANDDRNPLFNDDGSLPVTWDGSAELIDWGDENASRQR